MKKRSHGKKIADLRALLLESNTCRNYKPNNALHGGSYFPLLIFLALVGHFEQFKWFLLVSFFTDAIDGYLARRYSATSILGAKLDSIGDDLTVLAAVVGVFVVHFDFIEKELTLILILVALFLIQLILFLNEI